MRIEPECQTTGIRRQRSSLAKCTGEYKRSKLGKTHPELGGSIQNNFGGRH